jgi:hypothetical protein
LWEIRKARMQRLLAIPQVPDVIVAAEAKLLAHSYRFDWSYRWHQVWLKYVPHRVKMMTSRSYREMAYAVAAEYEAAEAEEE